MANSNIENKDSRRKLHIRTLLILFFDIITVGLSGFVALWIRFDCHISKITPIFLEEQVRILPIILVTFIAVYYLNKLYLSVWSYASVGELARIVRTYVILVPVIIIEKEVFHFHMPRSTYVIGTAISFLCCIAIRFSYRILRYYTHRRANRSEDTDRVMLIGSGAVAKELIADISISDKVHYQVVCIVDDNNANWGRFIGSVPIVGGRNSIPKAAEKYKVDRIIFSEPDMPRKDKAEILDIARSTGCHIQVIPEMFQFLSGELRISKIRDVDITDLLGRDEVKVNDKDIKDAIRGKVIMVTGGGGSIGSELCRQIAKSEPKQLIIFDESENYTYSIQKELEWKYPELDLIALIGNVRDKDRIGTVMKHFMPDAVYHAAAKKHVPLMEDSYNEAIKTNCIGTYNTALAAAKNGVKRFVLISTDKAVNPTSVMGATKRICEMIIQMVGHEYKSTTFCAVRFGNVLGSHGSVIPLFKKQIEAGGPVTVTDKNMVRYFMTIPEAVALILQAGHYAKGGEIFVLDMGEEVNIDDMARKMIELSGLTPDVDIKIEYTGIRPGEKLYEEPLVNKAKKFRETSNARIFIEDAESADDIWFKDELLKLYEVSSKESAPEETRKLIKEVVPTYSGI